MSRYWAGQISNKFFMFHVTRSPSVLLHENVCSSIGYIWLQDTGWTSNELILRQTSFFAEIHQTDFFGKFDYKTSLMSGLFCWAQETINGTRDETKSRRRKLLVISIECSVLNINLSPKKTLDPGLACLDNGRGRDKG